MKKTILFILMTTFSFNAIHAEEPVAKDPLQAKIYTLANGLKIFITVNKTEPKVQTYIAVKAGSKFDPSDNTGLAHYLEHLMFKGTPQFGTNNWEKEKVILAQISDLYEAHKAEKDSAKKKELYKKIDALSYEASKYAIPNEYDKIITSLGAQGTNAYTSNDQTVYQNIVPSNELEKWMKLESERFQNLVMRLFHTELEAVYEEYNISQDNDGRWAYANVLKALYPNHPYGTQTTIGEGEHLKNPSMVNIRKYFEKYYVPNNVAICLSGDLDPEKTVALVEKYFGSWKSKDIEPFKMPEIKPITAPLSIENLGSQEEFLYIGYRIPAMNDRESLKSIVIDQIMANGNAGIIDLNLVQKQKVLNAYSFPNLMHDFGAYLMYGKPKEGQSLEQVRDLLLEQIEQFKKGAWEDWMISASINDLELKKMKEYENNASRAGAFVTAFTNDIEWKDYVQQVEIMRSFTKQELIDFANKYYGNNYVVSYKRKGVAKSHKVDKPQITPVQMNRDSTSAFFNKLISEKSPSVEPVFVDFKKEIQSKVLESKTVLDYVKNKENTYSKYCIILPMGSDHSKMLDLSTQYLNYLGTDKLNAEEFRKELFKNGLEIGVSLQRDKTILTLSGLERNINTGIALLYDHLNSCKVDTAAWKNMISGILKQRDNVKTNKGAIFGALANYAKYGAKNPNNSGYSNEELKKLNPNEFITYIQSLLKYEHSLFFYGQDESKIVNAIAGKYTAKTKFVKVPELIQKFEVKDNVADKVFMYNYPTMVQSQIMLTHKSNAFDKSMYPFAYTFNDYFGSGLSSIVFQELREQKALAYSAYSVYRAPSNLNEPFFLQAFIGTQTDKMPTAAKEFRKLLNNMPKVPIQFNSSKESALKQIASDRIVRDNVYWSYLNYKKLGIDYDIRKDIYKAIETTTLEEFGNEFKKRISDKTFTTILMGDSSKMKLEDIKDFGAIEELNAKQLFGF